MKEMPELKRTNYFEINISGFVDNIEDIKILESNLDTEIAGFQHCWISQPKIVEVRIPAGLKYDIA